MRRWTAFAVGVLLVLPALVRSADTNVDLKSRVVVHEIENGMRFLIFERHDAPLVSMNILVKAGAANEVTTKTGIAHLLEHLAFKGTQTIGTTDYTSERKALEELDAAFEAYHSALRKGADSATVAALYTEFGNKQEQASGYVVQAEFSEIYERNGGWGLNASTSLDYTHYYLTLPSNRFELWCAMESDRLNNSVFREFYSERDVVLEERRMWIDNNPYGLLYEELESIAYKAHSYGHPVLGYYDDVKNLSCQDVRTFYETYYVPQCMTAAIVGDVDADDAIELIDTYFGRIPSRPDPPELVTTEPPQPGIRRVEMNGRSPHLWMNFHTVPAEHPDVLSLELLSIVLTSGPSSRLYRSLVEEKKMASDLGFHRGNFAQAGYMTLVGYPMKGKTAAQLEEAVLDEFMALKENPITQEELDAAKARWKVWFYSPLSSNLSLAFFLCWYDRCKGGWSELFDRIEEVDKITCQDLMDVSEHYLDPEKRTVATMEVKDE
ncbi:insulinase family protein [candidate division WOR-3 bacterium]|nr:insulinase family protein [candidate division WOR-3 bacterium]